MCLESQLERSAASLNRRWKRRRGPTGEVERPDMARHVESIAVPPDPPDDTALLFRRSDEGRACRMRAVLGRLTGDDRSQVPLYFAALLGYIERPLSWMTGATMRESDYTSMVDDDGVPRIIDMANGSAEAEQHRQAEGAWALGQRARLVCCAARLLG